MIRWPRQRALAGMACSVSCALFGAVLMSARAAAGSGQPSPKQMGFQEAVTPIAEQIHWMHDYVNAIIFAVTAFVVLLMAYVMVRFSEKRNPTPSRTTHNTTVEVLWTVIPVFILVAIAIPSFKLLYNQYAFPPPDLTIKATAHTWNWTHEYPDQGLTIESVMLQDSERADAVKSGIPSEQVPRNLAVDNEILVPVGKVVHVLVTSSDVIHNWTIPSFGSKVDAVPGRITATWFQATKEGIYFGQCSGAVRQGSRLHADRRARREAGRVRRLGGRAEGARQEEGQGHHPRRGGRACRQDQDRRQPAGQLRVAPAQGSCAAR